MHRQRHQGDPAIAFDLGIYRSAGLLIELHGDSDTLHADRITDAGPPPKCNDVGGYEAYQKKTGKACMF